MKQKKVLGGGNGRKLSYCKDKKFAMGFRCQLVTLLPWLVGSQQSVMFMRSRFQVTRHKDIRSEAGGS